MISAQEAAEPAKKAKVKAPKRVADPDSASSAKRAKKLAAAPPVEPVVVPEVVVVKTKPATPKATPKAWASPKGKGSAPYTGKLSAPFEVFLKFLPPDAVEADVVGFFEGCGVICPPGPKLMRDYTSNRVIRGFATNRRRTFL